MRKIILILILVLTGLSYCGVASAEGLVLPTVRLGLDKATQPEQVNTGIQILALFTILSLAPAILVMLTSFTRIIVVFSFLRQAMGTQQMPPNQIMVGLALFLTCYIMTPVWQQINTNAIQPYVEEHITYKEAIDKALDPVKTFMFKHTNDKDLAIFVAMAKEKKPNSREDIKIQNLVPAFVISELKTAFQIGFLIYVPFLVLDMVVASVLLSMGMMMLPPVMVSLPFKLLLFVLVDGWNLMVGSLVKSFQ
ncbi:MAG: flagellar type III secretion system pore protein FliP [Deltaproteobacteria bacterium]|nr:flagellar type III secretion system pore protein FliP [Deltaproteobacteria bacterium]MBF0526071.1 flagellar type III secretion system pore protein FliP [Deltaproteobacteria bacterium]